MADEFGQLVRGLHSVGDTPVATDTHVAVFALDDNGDYAYLNLDASGNLLVSGGGGGTQYDVDDVAGATDTGTLALVVRDDALTTLTPADGDYVQMRTDSTGALWVQFTNTSIAVTATDLDIRDLVQATDSVSIGDGTNLVTINADDGLEVHLNNASIVVTATDLDIRTLDSETPGDNVYIKSSTGDEWAIDGNGAGLVLTNYEYADDSAYAGGETGAFILAVRNDAGGTLASADQDFTPLQTDSSGNLRVSGQLTLGANDSVYSSGSANLVKDTITVVETISPGSDEQYSGLMVSGSGLCQWTLEFGTTSSEAVILEFWTTPSNPTQFVDLPDYLTVSSGETIRVRATNREKAASPASDFTGFATLIRSA